MEQQTKKEQIREAARKTFLTHGYSSSTLQMVADDIGSQRSLVNYYYPRKSDLLVDVLGTYLNTIITTVSERHTEPVIIYMISLTLFIKGMLATSATRVFFGDLMIRQDRDLKPYLNYHRLYEEIIDEYGLNIDRDDLLIREAGGFGLQTELLISWLNGHLNFRLEKIIEAILTCELTLIGIPQLMVKHKFKVLWKEVDELTENPALKFTSGIT